mmetsp:Transcript_41622/g.114764  ORF Transcript_41622/g.114764 Transcript_41622/m.114764 type:complete len:265 (-) Transcript_41622:92-886(-)
MLLEQVRRDVVPMAKETVSHPDPRKIHVHAPLDTREGTRLLDRRARVLWDVEELHLRGAVRVAPPQHLQSGAIGVLVQPNRLRRWTPPLTHEFGHARFARRKSLDVDRRSSLACHSRRKQFRHAMGGLNIPQDAHPRDREALQAGGAALPQQPRIAKKSAADELGVQTIVALAVSEARVPSLTVDLPALGEITLAFPVRGLILPGVLGRDVFAPVRSTSRPAVGQLRHDNSLEGSPGDFQRVSDACDRGEERGQGAEPPHSAEK